MIERLERELFNIQLEMRKKKYPRHNPEYQKLLNRQNRLLGVLDYANGEIV